jgi:RNA polymerase sigma-70 factor (ECF subfamily)
MSSAGAAGLPDEQLLRAARTDPDSPAARRAASQLLGRYAGRVYGWCRRYVRDHERAMDMAQEVLLNAYRALGGFEERAPVSAWLFAITRRQCIRAMRPRRLVRDEDVMLEHLEDPAPTPERAMERRNETERLMGVMRERLNPREQEAIWLRYVERATVDDITRTLGLENATGARGLLQGARRKLRAALGADRPSPPERTR